jgi:hypothetical protein
MLIPLFARFNSQCLLKKKKIVMTETNEWLEAHIKTVFQRTPNDFSVGISSTSVSTCQNYWHHSTGATKVAPKKLEAHVLGVHLNFLLG